MAKGLTRGQTSEIADTILLIKGRLWRLQLVISGTRQSGKRKYFATEKLHQLDPNMLPGTRMCLAGDHVNKLLASRGGN